MLAAVGHPPGVERVYVTGAAAIQHDLDPVFNSDLRHGEVEIALPVALLVLLFVFGLSAAVTIPLIFAGCTIMGALGIVYGLAHLAETPTYATNLVELIGLGIAVDYSLLIVYRFREELAAGKEVDDAVVATMQTAGRAVVFSGIAVALGLALLVAMPLAVHPDAGRGRVRDPDRLDPRSGNAPAGAALLLRPAGRGPPARAPPACRRSCKRGLGAPGPLDHGAAVGLPDRRDLGARRRCRPCVLDPGDARLLLRHPARPRSRCAGSTCSSAPSAPVRSHRRRCSSSRAPARCSPPPTRRRSTGSSPSCAGTPRLRKVYTGLGHQFVDPSRRYEQVIIAGHHDYGFPQEQAFVKRLRDRLIPAAGFPGSARVLVGGAPGQGVDFLHQAYTSFVPLIAAVLVLTYFLLMRAFRSVLLPFKAVLLNLLSVGASYGMLVVFFRFGLGRELFGLYQFGQVEGWIPIFLFAMLFGLSMDYEVFLVTRMRESWDEGLDNVSAVAFGLERTGRIITAAAIIMCAAFSGFVAGRIVGLQEFGLGLAVAIFVDATIVRSLLVPSMMAILGRWNWWLPAPAARLARVEASPLERRRADRRPAAT